MSLPNVPKSKTIYPGRHPECWKLYEVLYVRKWEMDMVQSSGQLILVFQYPMPIFREYIVWEKLYFYICWMLVDIQTIIYISYNRIYHKFDFTSWLEFTFCLYFYFYFLQ